MSLKNWRVFALVLLTAMAITGLFVMPESWVYLPLYMLTLAIICLKEFKKNHFGYLLGSILIVPVILSMSILLKTALTSSALMNSDIVLISTWWIIWLLYAIGMRNYFTNWIQPELRFWSLGLFSLTLCCMWITVGSLPAMYQNQYVYLVFAPGCLLVFVPLLTWIYKIAVSSIAKADPAKK